MKIENTKFIIMRLKTARKYIQQENKTPFVQPRHYV